MEYEVLADSDIRVLVAKVNEKIITGWRPQGGIAVAVKAKATPITAAGDPYYYQAMVRG